MSVRAKVRLLAAALAATLVVAAAPALAQDAAKYRLKPGAKGKLCLECHTDFAAVLAKKYVHEPVRAGNCADCHDPHAGDHGKLLDADPDRICATCHADLMPDEHQSAHTLAVDGKCVSCHDPHASDSPKNLLATGNDLCATCHADLVDRVNAADHGHAPARSNCLACHKPHASGNTDRLLKSTLPGLCLECHDPGRPQFTSAHMGYPVAASDCAQCHDPHGSPNKGILWASVHEPVSRRMCAQCHDKADAAEPLVTKRAGAALCRGCHNELVGETYSKNRVHWPVVDERACANCPNSHASANAKLLRAPEGQLCGSCHQDAVRRQERSATKHPPIADGECSTCHAPHASDSNYLLADNQYDLCGTCHDWQGHTAHPLGDETKDPRNANLTVACLSCHRTHGSPIEHLLHFDAKRDLCVECHGGIAQ